MSSALETTRATRVLAIVGPTASGKSEIALAAAAELEAEIISADSMAVYRGMDIGTAKPAAAVRGLVRHHLIDVADPDEEFSAAKYQRLSRAAITDISSRGKTPVMVGGSGLYVRAALDDLEFPAAAGKLDTRRPGDALAELERLDPRLAARIDRQNPRRVTRALVIASQGLDTAELDLEKRRFIYDTLMVGIRVPRDELVRRIDARVDAMLDAGLVDEVAGLVAGGHFGLTAERAVGYAEILACLKGATSLSAAVESIKIHSRQLAKRQMTWFRKDDRVQWLDVGEKESAADVAARLISLARDRRFVVF